MDQSIAITISPDSAGRVYEGIGVLGAEPCHARTREEMEHTTWECFERGYEWWLAAEAKRWNPDTVIGCTSKGRSPDNGDNRNLA